MKNSKVQNIAKNIKTFCPLFTGFYCSEWENLLDMHVENEIEYINEQRDQKGFEAISYDSLAINYNFEAYAKEIFVFIVDYMNEQIEDETNKKLITKATFESLHQPKQYNYTTDSINCTF